MATIEEIRNLAEPLKGYQFKITIANPPGSGASIEEMQFLCQATALPGRSIDSVLTTLGGHTVTDPGKTSGPRIWTTTFAETTDNSIIQRINSWQQVCSNEATGVQGTRADYWRNARVELLNNAKEVTLTRQLIGIWPQDMTDMSLDTGSSDVVTLDVTWEFQYHEDI